MSFDTAKGRRDEYIKSCLKVSDRIPSDDEIYVVTGYVSWRIRLRFIWTLSATFLVSGACAGAIVLIANWLKS